MSSSDSDSSEDLEALREAVDSTLAVNFAPKDATAAQTSNSVRTSAKSGRPERELSSFEKDNLTPDFKRHLAKKLDQIIESRIKLTKIKKVCPTEPAPSEEEAGQYGIQLFSSSTALLTLEESDPGAKPRRRPKSNRKRRTGSCSPSSPDESEKLSSVTVDAEWVLQRKGAYLGDAREADFLVARNGDCRETGRQPDHRSGFPVADTTTSNGHHRSACRKKKKKEKKLSRDDESRASSPKPKRKKRKTDKEQPAPV